MDRRQLLRGFCMGVGSTLMTSATYDLFKAEGMKADRRLSSQHQNGSHDRTPQEANRDREILELERTVPLKMLVGAPLLINAGMAGWVEKKDNTSETTLQAEHQV
ncbi:MAG: hypothetical protein WAZ18_06190 [Alphaproteobacteria bacterium]